jgi:hypothetical protein
MLPKHTILVPGPARVTRCLHLLWCEVLSFINDHELADKGPAAHEVHALHFDAGANQFLSSGPTPLASTIIITLQRLRGCRQKPPSRAASFLLPYPGGSQCLPQQVQWRV